MKYYSEKLKSVFETIKELEAAETEFEKKEKELQAKKEAKIVRVKEIEAKDEAIKKLIKEKNELINKFIQDYPEGFHSTIKTPIVTAGYDSVLDWFIDNLF